MACHCTFKARGTSIAAALLLGALLLGGPGCRRSTPSASASPASQPAHRSASSGISLLVDGVPTEFPRVILQAESTGGGLTVHFNTPTSNPETGNALNFDLKLEDVDDVAGLAGAAWHFRSDDGERADTLNGITLHGTAVLEPTDVHLLFGREGEIVTVELDGQFNWFDPPDADKPLKVVNVSGKFSAGRANAP